MKPTVFEKDTFNTSIPIKKNKPRSPKSYYQRRRTQREVMRLLVMFFNTGARDTFSTPTPNKKNKRNNTESHYPRREHTGKSAAFSLCTTEKGREVLLSNKSLINKINKTSLNHIDEGSQSVLSILSLSPTGKKILKMIPDTASKIKYEATEKLEYKHKTAVKKYLSQNQIHATSVSEDENIKCSATLPPTVTTNTSSA